MSGQTGVWWLLGLGLAFGIGWGGARIRQWWQRPYHEEQQRLATLLGSYYHKMAATITDRQGLAQLLAVEIPAALGIQQAAILLLAGQELVADGELRLPVNNAAVRQVVASGAAMRVNGELQTVITQGRLDFSWTAVWVPLMRGTSLYGLWLLGSQVDGRSASVEQLQWYTTLARQAALILATAQIAGQEQEKARQLQALYQEAVASSERERSRLARELHDGVLQDLCAIARDLKAVDHNRSIDAAQVAVLTSYADEAVTALRTICHNLRPPFLSHNLPLALQVLVERHRAQSTAHISLKTTVETLLLPEETTIALYRIAQEALTNALKHSGATAVTVSLLTRDQRVELEVADNGQGFDVTVANGSGGLGLVSIRERAEALGGEASFFSQAGEGTCVRVSIPLGRP